MPKRSQTAHERLVAFVGENLNGAQLAVLTGWLEERHTYRSQGASPKQRFDDLVYLRLDDATAQKYLDEFRRRRENGEPLLRR